MEGDVIVRQAVSDPGSVYTDTGGHQQPATQLLISLLWLVFLPVLPPHDYSFLGEPAPSSTCSRAGPGRVCGSVMTGR